MARKHRVYVENDEGRDNKKVFLITEMSASRAEKWAARAFLALAKSGIDFGPEIVQGGLAGIALVGLRALGGVEFADAEPLLDELMSCVTLVPDTNMRDPISGNPISRLLIEDDIEEVATRIKLRAEVFELHTGFSMTGVKSKLT